MNSGKQSTNLQMTLREVNRVGEVKKNVPKLRFKGYEDSWEQRKLGTIITVHPSKDLIVEAVEDEGRSIVVQQGDSPILGYSNAEGFEGYINVTIFGDHTVSLYKPQLPFVVATDGVKILSSSILQHQYFYTVLEKYKPIPQGYKRHFSILKEQIANITVNKDEQKKIGEFFETIGDLITLHQRKYDALKSMKKTLLSKMFPKNGEDVPEIRFKGFTDAWEQRKFSEIALRESTVQESSRDFPSVEYEDVIAEAGRLNKDVNQKEVAKKGIVFDGSQVLYGKLRPYLHNWLSPDFSGVAVGDWWVLKPVKVDKSFLYRLIQTQQFDDIANQSTGSKMPRADWNLVSNLEFAVPVSGDEQSKIGGYFSSLDTLITLHQRKLDELKNMKKTLLQQMFV